MGLEDKRAANSQHVKYEDVNSLWSQMLSLREEGLLIQHPAYRENERVPTGDYRRS